jgi:hypothetical protein
MNGRILFGTLAVVVVLVAAGLVAWWAVGPDVGRHMDRRTGPEPATRTASMEAANAGEDKLVRLGMGDTVRLSTEEVNGLLSHQLAGWVPAALARPGVSLGGDSLVISGDVATRELPATRELEAVRFLLPDTARVSIAGRLEPLDGGRTAFDVDALTIANVPIPRRVHATLLARLGRSDEPGLAPTAIAFPLPAGVTAARVEAGSLLLVPAPSSATN